MLANKDILDSLLLQPVCPKCGVSWLGLDPETMFILTLNCEVCEVRFKLGGLNENRNSENQNSSRV